MNEQLFESITPEVEATMQAWMDADPGGRADIAIGIVIDALAQCRDRISDNYSVEIDEAKRRDILMVYEGVNAAIGLLTQERDMAVSAYNPT